MSWFKNLFEIVARHKELIAVAERQKALKSVWAVLEDLDGSHRRVPMDEVCHRLSLPQAVVGWVKEGDQPQKAEFAYYELMLSDEMPDGRLFALYKQVKPDTVAPADRAR